MKKTGGGNPERSRIHENNSGRRDWKFWGPYLGERAWGTVREDYSGDGEAWESFFREQVRARTCRWTEDGLGGICDREQRLCLALALWNGRDPFLKERAFGLINREGNHGEDLKDLFFFLEGTSTASYLRYLYKYPQKTFPYERIKRDTDDIYVRVRAFNRGKKMAPLHLLPTFWFRNTWSWGGPWVPHPRLRVRNPLSLGQGRLPLARCGGGGRCLQSCHGRDPYGRMVLLRCPSRFIRGCGPPSGQKGEERLSRG